MCVCVLLSGIFLVFVCLFVCLFVFSEWVVLFLFVFYINKFINFNSVKMESNIIE